MTLGMSAYTADGFLNALGNATAFSVTTVYAQLHLGDPGAAGTANLATEQDREIVSFGAPSAGSGTRQIANDAEVAWSPVEAGVNEDPTHVSLWDAATAGNYLGSGTITGNAINDGDTYRAAVGAIVVSLPVAA